MASSPRVTPEISLTLATLRYSLILLLHLLLGGVSVVNLRGEVFESLVILRSEEHTSELQSPS